MEYISRICDRELEEYLKTFGAVLVEGPKWCGKTTTASRQAASELRIADPSNNYQNKRLAEIDVATALEGARPRLIDEWQEVPSTWDAVRYSCDQVAGQPGQFLLTGSATPREEKKPIHSGAGRIGKLRMDTMTLYEMGLSSGKSSLEKIFSGESPAGVSAMTLQKLAEQICRGGWPAAIHFNVEQAIRISRAYIDAVASEDLEKIDGVARDPKKIKRLIVSLARNEATLASKKTIVADTSNIDGGLTGGRLAESTVSEYLTSLQKIFFVDDIPAWNPALRSPVRIRSAAKHHLSDVSLAAAALGATPDTLVADQKTMGFLFESLVAHDLIIYARNMDAKVYHYRDDSNLEVDLIIQKNNGDWGAFEVKMGAVQEDDGAAKVLALDKKMTERGECPASAKAVIVGVGGVAHMRPDGVAVIPFDTLGI